ncbi:hypothetical protein ILUMI_14141 [Ignelater luminosus]|uniref:SCP domain-containing protein n=1 Tax=Ignelater luminosus TaxID=2038154 RepID=A0A8K0G812_IGNLU|nr:hypothetical protein ILUMI_14141 [Ignelater luminosus]
MLRALSIIFLISNVICMINGQCQGVYETGVNANDQATIINKHNEFRLQLAKGEVEGQPRACNMKRLKYDNKLAAEAQKIANTCKFDHVPVHDSRWFGVGQNLYISRASSLTKGADWNAAVQYWFDEHNNYRYPDESGANTGHYTQLGLIQSTLDVVLPITKIIRDSHTKNYTFAIMDQGETLAAKLRIKPQKMASVVVRIFVEVPVANFKFSLCF